MIEKFSYSQVRKTKENKDFLKEIDKSLINDGKIDNVEAKNITEKYKLLNHNILAISKEELGKLANGLGLDKRVSLLNAIKKLKEESRQLSVDIQEVGVLDESFIDSTSREKHEKDIELEIPEIPEVLNMPEIIELPEEGFKLKQLSFEYLNDNGINPNGEIFGADTGRTFGFDLNAKIEDSDNNYKVNTGFEHYTSGEGIVYDKNGNRLWNSTGFKDSTRIDYAHLDIQKEYYKSNNGFNLTGYAGTGIDAIGNFGGKAVQGEYHKLMDYYTHKAPYENNAGFSPIINGSVEIDKILYGNENKGVYAYGNLDVQIALIQKYGMSNISGKVGMGANYNGFGVEISHIQGYTKLPSASSTMKNSGLNGHDSSSNLKIYTPIPLIKGSTVYYEYRKGKQDYMMLGVSQKF